MIGGNNLQLTLAQNVGAGLDDASGFTIWDGTTTNVRFLAGGLNAFGTPSPAGSLHAVPPSPGSFALVVTDKSAAQSAATVVVGDVNYTAWQTCLRNRWDVYNVNSGYMGEATDYEKMRFVPVANRFDFTTSAGGTGTVRDFGFAGGNVQIDKSVILNLSASRLKWGHADQIQTTVGAAGGASALPASPTKYLKVVGSDGTEYVIPAFAVS
jgi:hypothetical protein